MTTTSLYPPVLLDGARHYKIQGVIGNGKHTNTYHALCTQDGWPQSVALKILCKPGGRFFLWEEARILGLMTHHNIPRVYGRLLVKGRPAIILEYVPGVPLSMLLREFTFLREGIALKIVAEVAGALATLHERPDPIVYCDVCPGNILITPWGGVKLIDFGAARLSSVGPYQRMRGEITYFAPERFHMTTPETDMYSLGLLLCQLLTGELLCPPFDIGRIRGRAYMALQKILQETEAITALVISMLGTADGTRAAASDVETRCREILYRIGPPSLSSWARQHVTQLDPALGWGELSGLRLQDPPGLTMLERLTRWWSSTSI